MKSRVKGAVAFRRLLKQLPDSARSGMADILDSHGSKLLAAMRQDVPEDTGLLRSRLSKSFTRSALRLRVGFVGKRANGPVKGRRGKGDPFSGKQFYGRFVEFGRKAQTVTVRRRKTGATGLRNGRKRAEDLAATYQLHVRARAARPFVYKRRPTMATQLNTALNSYWNNVLLAAGSGVGSDD